MYRIGICDDSQADRMYIQDLVSAWSRSCGNSTAILEFTSAENFLFQEEESSTIDILLLDIEMGRLDGVSLAKKIRQKNETMQIVFITGYSDYIAEGYEVSALHYLMKPVSRDKLFSVLNRAAEKLAKNEKVLQLQTGSELVRIPIYQIRYADVTGNYVTIHANLDFKVKMPLGELEKELDDRFHRVGRSAIVNLGFIQRVTKSDIFLNDGSAIPVPRGAYEGVNRAIINMR